MLLFHSGRLSALSVCASPTAAAPRLAASLPYHHTDAASTSTVAMIEPAVAPGKAPTTVSWIAPSAVPAAVTSGTSAGW